MTQVRTPHKTPDSGRIEITSRNGTYTALGYRSARLAEREGRSYGNWSGDANMRYDRGKLVNQSRAFYSDNAIYKGMIDRAVDYIMGNGFALQVQTTSDSFNQKVEGLWKTFWNRPEIRGLLSGAEFGEMVCREVILTGDSGVIKTNKGVCQVIESEQITRGSHRGNGIERNRYGAPERFWVCPYGDSGNLKTGSAKLYLPEQFLFISKPDRPSSTRGVPACQAGFPMLHRINDVCDSEAIAWQMLSRMAIAITRENGAETSYIESKEDPAKAGADTSGQLATRLTELEYALIFQGSPGEGVKGIEHDIPGKNFSESLRMFLRLLGLPLGLPLELILLDWTKSNYSQSRAVLEQAYQIFLKWQQKIADFMMTPIFEWKLNQWRGSRLLGNRKDIPFQWIKPTFPWIDQLKETQACAAKVDRGFMTHSEVCKSRGQDREEVCIAREREVRDAIARAQKIKEDTQVDVPWQIFAGMEQPGQVKAIQPDEEDIDKKDQEKKDAEDK